MMRVGVSVLLICAFAVALPVRHEVKGPKSFVVFSDEAGSYIKTSKGSTFGPTATSRVVHNESPVVWHQEVSPAIFQSVASSAAAGEMMAGTTFLDPVEAELVELTGSGNTVLETDGPSNGGFNVLSSKKSNYFATVDNIPDGWNLTSVVRIYQTGNPKAVVSKTYNGVGEVVLCPFGKFWSFVGFVDNSYVMQGHGLIETFNMGELEPVMSLALPYGEMGGRSTSFNSRGEVAMAVGRELRVYNMLTGDVVFATPMQYPNCAFALSDTHLSVALLTLEIYERAHDGSFTLIHQDNTSPWLVHLVGFSPDGKSLALASMNGHGIRQNLVTMFDVSKPETVSLLWNNTQVDVNDQDFQNAPTAIVFTEDSSLFAMSNWGVVEDRERAPQVQVFCAVCGKEVFNFTTPGSMYDLDMVKLGTSVSVVVGGKHGHANTEDVGGDLYSLKFDFEPCTHT